MQTMMRDAAISFPMLGDWSINPPASFRVFGLTVYFYGVILAFTFLVAVAYAVRRAHRFGIKGDDVYDLVLWVLPLAIVCGRLYYVLCEWQQYKSDLASIVRIWEGGIAMYGCMIGGIAGLIIWSKRKKVSIPAALDMGGCSLILGQCFGRWSNFINREAFGGETDVFCRMGLTLPGQETLYVHPYFLYETLWSVTGFLLLHFWVNSGRRKYDGQTFMMYILWYGTGRCMLEGLRTDSLYIPGTGIRISQLVAGVSALCALALLIINARRSHPDRLVDRVAAAAAGETAEKAPDSSGEDISEEPDAPLTGEAGEQTETNTYMEEQKND